MAGAESAWTPRRASLDRAQVKELDALGQKFDVTEDMLLEAFEMKYGELNKENFKKFPPYCVAKAEPRRAIMQTPATKRKASVAGLAMTPAPEAKRSNSVWSPAVQSPTKELSQGLAVTAQINANLAKTAATAPQLASGGKWLRVELAQGASRSYRAMQQGAPELSAAINDRLERLETMVVREAMASTPDLEHIPVGRACLTTAIVSGRVCCECDYLTDGNFKLNEQSLILEGSRGTSNGLRCELRTSSCPEVQLFPGQVIAAIGKTDPKGNEFYAERIFTGLKVASPSRPLARIKEMMPAWPMSFVVAAGPFSAGTTLDFGVLDALTNMVATEKPRTVVLLGPLVDINNKLIASGDLRNAAGEMISFDDIYSLIFEKIQKLAAVGSQVVIVPALNEALLPCATLPQPPYAFDHPAWKNVTKLQNIRLASNPATLCIGGLRVAVTSTDPMLPVLGDLLVRRPENAPARSPVETALSLLLAQRSLFPAHPAPKGHGCAKLAASHLSSVEFGLEEAVPEVPDMCFFYSRLQHMAKCVDDRVFINPGPAARDAAWGTAASIHIRLPAFNDQSGDIPLDLGNRTRVDFVKL